MNLLRIVPMLPLALAACTLNVEAASEEKYARYRGNDFQAFRAEVHDLPDGIKVHGWDAVGADAHASVVALVAPGDGDLLRDAHLELFRRGDALHLGLDGTRSLESLYFEWVSVRLPRATDFQLQSECGDIEVAGMEGVVRVETDSGDISAATLATVHLESDSGDVHARARGGRIETDSGDVSFRVEGVPLSTRIETDSGDVRLRLPQGVGCVLELTSDSGEIQVDAGGRWMRRDGHAFVELGGGGPLIRVVTDSGDVRVTEY